MAQKKNDIDGIRRLFTIGVLVDWINTSYHMEIMSGIYDFIKENDLNLISFVSGRFESPHGWEKNQNIIASFIDNDKIDGLILFSTAGNIVGKDYMINLTKKFKDIPIITISDQLPGHSAVLLDNKKGMTEIVEHMVSFHGYKRLVFIRGPQDNEEAQVRYKVYQDVLKKNGLPLDPNLIFNGDYNYSSGKEAMKTLLDKPHAQFDAIVASNDNMALGALEELRVRGYFASDSIPIIGFDDSDASAEANLTTSKQPLYEEGYQAAQILLQEISDKKAPQIVKLPSSLVIRESCGCYSSTITSAITATYSIEEAAYKGAIEENQDKIISKILSFDIGLNRLKGNYIRNWIKIALAAFIDELKQKKSNYFLSEWKKVITWAMNERINLTLFQNLLSVFRRSIIPYISEKAVLYYVEDLFHEARIMVSEAMQKSELMHKILNQNQMMNLNNVGAELSTELNLEKQMDILAHEIFEIGISTFYLSLYKDPLNPLNHSKLILCFVNGNRINLDKEGLVFRTLDIIPSLYWPKEDYYHLCIMDLYHGNQQIGFFILDYKPENGEMYNILMTKIGIALDAAILVEKIQNQAQYLEEEVKQRTKDLVRINSQLQIEIAERRRAEEKLRRSEEKYREMALFLPTIIFETDIHMQFNYINKSGLELFGLTEEDIKKGVSYLDYIPAEDRKRFDEYCARVVEGNQMSFNEFRLLKKDSSKINLLGKGTPIINEKVIDGIRWNAIDIKPLMANAFMPDESFFEKFPLSAREKEVMRLLLEGHKNREIAEALFITEATVKDHAGAVYAKLKIKNREGLFNKVKEYQISRFGYHSYIFSLFTRLLKES